MERAPSTQQSQEEQIQYILRRVPHEIAILWEQKTEELSVSDQLQELQRLYALRERKTHSFVASAQSPSSTEVVHTSPLAVRQFIEHLNDGEHEYVGEGKSARVLASVRNPKVCYKVFFPLDRQPLGTNSIALEADMQQEIVELGEYAGVRAPKLHYYIANDTMRAIAMERLNAVSIEDVLFGRVDVPTMFEQEKFFNALEKYMHMLNEKDIFHRDLHGGNVLVDNTTGMPFVIDFGHAIRSIAGDEVYRAEVVKSGHKVIVMLKSDPEQVQRLRADMKKYISMQQEVI